jgi:regulation of enolase protein 1 (concanavalin A-like superfamily)
MLVPEDFVFAAMTHHHLGHAKQAQESFDAFRELIRISGSDRLHEWRRYLAEGEVTLGLRAAGDMSAAKPAIAGWGQPIDPLGDCEFQSSGGSLTIRVPVGVHNLTPTRQDYDAPRVLQEVSGDFTVQVKVSCSIQPQTPLAERALTYWGAGLLVWESPDNFLRVERNGYYRHATHPTGYEPVEAAKEQRKYSSHAPLVEYWRGGRQTTGGNNWNASAPPLSGATTWLRLTRRGASFRVAISQDGQRWQVRPPFETTFPTKVQLGVVAINSSADPFTAEFSDWRLTQP